MQKVQLAANVLNGEEALVLNVTRASSDQFACVCVSDLFVAYAQEGGASIALSGGNLTLVGIDESGAPVSGTVNGDWGSSSNISGGIKHNIQKVSDVVYERFALALPSIAFGAYDEAKFSVAVNYAGAVFKIGESQIAVSEANTAIEITIRKDGTVAVGGQNGRKRESRGRCAGRNGGAYAHH